MKTISAAKLEFFLNMCGVTDFQFNNGTVEVSLFDNYIGTRTWREGKCAICDTKIFKREIFVIKRAKISDDFNKNIHLKCFSEPFKIQKVCRADGFDKPENSSRFDFLNKFVGATVIPSKK